MFENRHPARTVKKQYFNGWNRHMPLKKTQRSKNNWRFSLPFPRDSFLEIPDWCLTAVAKCGSDHMWLRSKSHPHSRHGLSLLGRFYYLVTAKKDKKNQPASPLRRNLSARRNNENKNLQVWPRRHHRRTDRARGVWSDYVRRWGRTPSLWVLHSVYSSGQKGHFNEVSPTYMMTYCVPDTLHRSSFTFQNKPATLVIILIWQTENKFSRGSVTQRVSNTIIIPSIFLKNFTRPGQLALLAGVSSWYAKTEGLVPS